MMDEERRQILEMVREGKISTDEAMKLLDALGKDEAPAEPARSKGISTNRMLHIQVEGPDEEVNVNIPLRLIKSLSKMARFIPKQAAVKLEEEGIDLADFDLEAMAEALEAGIGDGELVHVETGDTEIHIYIE